MNFARAGAISAFVAVALGAFGAHALKSRLAPEALQIWHTAVLYQLVHSVALFSLGLYAKASKASIAGWLFTIGIVFFSGSLYALAISGIKPFGAVTPLGGVCFLAGWAWLAAKIA